ncbi:MAG TPA: DUF362 domain-containing protein [Candidatus Eisenbacteria bacterium]|nr:DUF362 domain-containing protein [Candidatus Eisenbacteria bacterium]
MKPKVALIEFDDNPVASVEKAVELIGGISDLNNSKRQVTVKVGVFDPKDGNHTTLEVAHGIIKCFDKAPKIFFTESDNYRGTGLERLQIWKKLFSYRVFPHGLSEDPETKKVRVAGVEMNLSKILFKPNVFVSTHVTRGFEKGSILKNLFGLVPDPKKAKFHKKLPTLLCDIYEAIGGIDLAVLDGTYYFAKVGGENRTRMNTLLAGRDAVAVETVGAVLCGIKLEKMDILHEAVKRGLGEGDLDKIEIVGTDYEKAEEKFARARKAMRQRT